MTSKAGIAMALLACGVTGCGSAGGPDYTQSPEVRACEPLTTNPRVAYAAAAADGRIFVVFYPPTLDAPSSAMRVFFGDKDRLTERRLLRADLDSSIHLEFDLEGKRAQAQLNFASTWMGWGPPRIEVGTDPALRLTPLPGSPGDGWGEPPPTVTLSDGGTGQGPRPPPTPPATLLAGLGFFCF